MSTFASPGASATDGPTAIVLIDLYNDFIHPDGKLFSSLADTLAEHDTIAHLHQLVACARKHHIPIYYGLHQQWKPGFYQGWAHMALRTPRARVLPRIRRRQLLEILKCVRSITPL